MQQKGAALRSTLRAIETLHGPEAVAAVKARMPEALRAQIEPTVIVAGWYPVEITAALHLAIRDELGKGSWEHSRKLGQAAADIDFNGVYRVILRSMRYDTVWDRIEQTWRGYNTQGAFKWLERRPGLMHCEVTDVVGFNAGMWLGATGRATRLMELAGAKAAHATMLESTPTRARFEVLWLE